MRAQNGAFANELSRHLGLPLDELKTLSATVQKAALKDSAQAERRIVTWHAAEKTQLRALGLEMLIAWAGTATDHRVGAMVLWVFDCPVGGNPNNAAMLYVIAPRGDNCEGPKHGPNFDAETCTIMLYSMASRVIDLVRWYNQHFPDAKIGGVRTGLFGGGVYRHPSLSPHHVASAIISGFLKRQNTNLVLTLVDSRFNQAVEAFAIRTMLLSGRRFTIMAFFEMTAERQLAMVWKQAKTNWKCGIVLLFVLSLAMPKAKRWILKKVVQVKTKVLKQ